MSNASQDVPGDDDDEILNDALMVRGDSRVSDSERALLTSLEVLFAHGHRSSLSPEEREVLEEILERATWPDPLDGDG